MTSHSYFKCDRCGKKAEKTEDFDVDRVTKVRRYFWLKPQRESQHFDLCESCTTSLDRWLTSAQAIQ